MNSIETDPKHAAEEAMLLAIEETPPPPAPEVKIRPPREKRKRNAIVFSAALFVILAIAAYMKRAAFPDLFELTPYAPAIAFVSIGVVGVFFKDKYTKPIAGKVVAAMFVFFGFMMGLNTYHERAAAKIEKKATANAVVKQNETIVANAERNEKSINGLTEQLKDFKDKVRPNEIQSQMYGLRETMEKVINPPKADLQFSFSPYNISIDDTGGGGGRPVKDKIISLADDGTLHIDFTILNGGDVNAVDGEMTIQICDACKFAKEPTEFRKLPGENEIQRNKVFERILSKVAFYVMSIDIIPPAGARDVWLGMYFRCRTCVNKTRPDQIMIQVAH
jgi:hypothetical protein